jgi:hypothetical protein
VAEELSRPVPNYLSLDFQFMFSFWNLAIEWDVRDEE